MTCIVGIADGQRVLIGGDSAAGDSYYSVSRADEKVFTNGPFAFGFTTSFRMGQLLRYSLSPPDRLPKTEVARYMATQFIDSVRACLKAGGYAKLDNGAEKGGTFLVGYAGRLFEVYDDYQVGEPVGGIAAVGAGLQYALGALFAHKTGLARYRATLALQAAEKYCGFVKGPFKFVSVQ